jgi:hypothetical protein
MTRFNFSVTLLACIGAEADTRAEAEQKLREALTGSNATLGTLGGEPVVATIEIEGTLDLIDFEDSAGNEPITAVAGAQPSTESALARRVFEHGGQDEGGGFHARHADLARLSRVISSA